MVGWKKYEIFGCCDLALDPMIYASELDLDMVVTYLHAENYIDRSSSSKLIIGKKKETQLLAAVTLHLIL